jgi:ribosome assembly protein 1
LDIDPFWIPFTADELEDLGEKADRENLAKKYMDAVRERKGLTTTKKLVEDGEKQKNLRK